MMAKVVALAAVLFAGAMVAWSCSPFGGAGAFQCESDTECQGAQDGRCEPNGFCSFLDDTCGLGGRRYGGLSGSLAGTCVGAEPIDAAVIDTPLIDATLPEAGETCLGATGGLVQPCFAVAPSGTVTLAGAIDTDTSPLCSTIVSNTTACVIASGSIQIDAATTVTATGTKPLVLAATGTVTINGVLDVASHRGVIAPGASGNDATCDPGTPPTTNGNAGGGGGGGSFGAKGGDGGDGNGGGGPDGGTSGAAALPPTTLRGGCKAQDGKEGAGAAATRGLGGNGGGVVYVIAGTTLSIGAGGVINASGAGGTNGVTARAGGGGGGSGGLVGLDAPTVTNGGVVFANGGSGAEGSGDNNPGKPGVDPTGAGPAVFGIGISNTGGDGGNGGAGAAGAGANGLQSTDGGGGGGGVGVIRVFPLQAIGGAVSPPPT